MGAMVEVSLLELRNRCWHSEVPKARALHKKHTLVCIKQLGIELLCFLEIEIQYEMLFHRHEKPTLEARYSAAWTYADGPDSVVAGKRKCPYLEIQCCGRHWWPLEGSSKGR